MKLHEFIHQKSYEKIIYRLRRHWIAFVPFILLFVVLLSAPFFIWFLINSIYPTLISNDIFYAMSVVFGAGYTLLTLIFFYSHFVDYYLDVWIVTNDRIIDIEQFGLFRRTISELDLFQIQDVTTDVHGILGTLFQYGNVIVKTASNNADIVFRQVSRPNTVRHHLLQLADADRRHHLNIKPH